MTKTAKETDSPRTPAEDRFLAECFLASDAGQVTRGPMTTTDLGFRQTDRMALQVDMAVVAQAMGYANPHSAANKYGELKKKLYFAAKAFNTSPQKVIILNKMTGHLADN